MSRLALLLASCALFVVGTLSRAAGAPDDEATTFFKTHANEIDLKEEGGRLLFANKQIGVEFRKGDRTVYLSRIYGIAGGQDYLAKPLATTRPSDIYAVRMALDPKFVGRNDSGKTEGSLMGIVDEMAKDAFPVGPEQARSISWRQEGNGGETTLHLEWKDLDVREEKGVVDIDATVKLRAGDPLSYWRINVRNRGARYGIERVRFPIVNLGPIGKADEDALVWPQSRGRLLENPFKETRTIQGYYTCEFEMQFQALYSKLSGAGLYLATQESVPCLSYLKMACSTAGIEWSIGQFPPNITFAQDAPGDDAEDYHAPYDVVIGPFHGDWYDACQIYRRWALKQSWSSKGPLASRQDVPKWYKEAPLYFYTVLNDSAEGTHSMDENLKIAADEFRTWLKWAGGMKLPLNLYAWEQPVNGLSVRDTPFHSARSTYTSRSGRWSGMTGHNFYDGNYPVVHSLKQFAAECASLRHEGGMVSPYVALELFNQGPAENAPYAAEAKPEAVRDLFGCIRTWGGDGAWQMCSGSAWWRQRLVETCSLLLEREHVGGLYLDVMRGSCLPCYWTPHGHTAAGGDSMTTSRHELVKAIRDAVRARDPDAIMTGENPSENMIDVIDGMLVYTMWPDANVPLLATVYQDYIKRYGLELSSGAGYRNRFASTWDENAFFIECASLFVEGTQVGRIRLKPRDASLSVNNPQQKEMIRFLGQIVGYSRQEASGRFLAYGQLVRPLTFGAPSPMPMLSYKPGGQVPALVSGVFRLENGSLGVFLVNSAPGEARFAAELDPARYGIAPNTELSVDAIAPDGSVRRVTAGTTGRIPLEGSLPGRGITMFRITPMAG